MIRRFSKSSILEINVTIQFSLLLVVACTAIYTDLFFKRIPNVVCLFGIVGGILIHLQAETSLAGFLTGLGGMFSAGLVLLPLYVMGGMAAGDVKLMAAVGCILGWPFSIEAGFLSLISGTFLGIAYYVLKGGLVEFCQRYGSACKYLWVTGRFRLPPAPADSVAHSRFPYALAIAAGSFASLQIGVGLR